MKEKRCYSAAAHHDVKGFLIMGGIVSGTRSSTEITKDGVTFEDFTPLPIALERHCAVALNDEDAGDFFVAGGHSYSGGYSVSKRAFIHKGDQWNEMAELSFARYCKKPSLEMESKYV